MSPALGIEQLEKRFQADPTSKAFLPLAEAHRKAGQHDRAIEILRAGLEHNKNYTAARVALARALLAVNQSDEARVILTRVVEEVPDNLLAARLLDIAGGPLQGESEVSTDETDVATDKSGPEDAPTDPLDDDAPGRRDAGSTQVFEEAFAEVGSAAAGETTSPARDPENTSEPDLAPEGREGSHPAAGLGLDPNATQVVRLDDAIDPGSASGRDLRDAGEQNDTELPGDVTSRANRDDLQDETAEEPGAGAEGVDAHDVTFPAGSTDGSPPADLLGDAGEPGGGPDNAPELIAGVHEPVWATESDADEVREPEPDVPVDSWQPDPDATGGGELDAIHDDDDSSFAPYETLRLSKEEAARYVEAGEVPAVGAPAEDEERGSQGVDSREPGPGPAGVHDLGELNLSGFEEARADPELADEPDAPTESEDARFAADEGLPLATAENETELADEPEAATEPEDARFAADEGLPLATAENETELADEPEAATESEEARFVADEGLPLATAENETELADEPEAATESEYARFAADEGLPAADEMSADGTGDDDLFAVEHGDDRVKAPESSGTHPATDGLLVTGDEPADDQDRQVDELPDTEATRIVDEVSDAEPVQVVDESLADAYDRAVDETLGGEPGAADEPVLAEPLPVDEFASPAPQDSSRLLTLARMYRRKGEPDRAAGIYRDLLEDNPSHDEARRELAELCGEGLAEITSEDIVDHVPAHSGPFPRACAESLSDVRRRRIDFLKSWLDHIRAEG